jgi:hypothetical protein
MYGYGPHTFNRGAWHFCMRCDIKSKLNAMTWQRGLLLCRECLDPWPLEGQREQAISQVLTDGKVDFQIDPKLTYPIMDSDDLLMF